MVSEERKKQLGVDAMRFMLKLDTGVLEYFTPEDIADMEKIVKESQ